MITVEARRPRTHPLRVVVFFVWWDMTAPKMSASQSASRLVSAAELARMLSTSVRTIRRLDSAGKLPRGIRLGGLKRWRQDEITAWIGAGCPVRAEWKWT